MKRNVWIAVLIAVALLGASLVAWGQGSRVTEAELRMVVKQEQKERELLDREWNSIAVTPERTADQKRWQSATDKVCRPTSDSIEHQIESLRCKIQRYRVRRSHVHDDSSN